MANKGNFNLEKGGNGTTGKGGNGKINLNKENAEELLNGIEVDEFGNPVGPVRIPQPEDPASVLEPEVSEESVKDAIENGPEEPKKKGFAWLWALIGIAIVLAFLGMLFLNREDKAADVPAGDREAVIASADTVADASADSIAAAGNEAGEQGNALDQAVAGVSGAAAEVGDAASKAMGATADAVKGAASEVAEAAGNATEKAANAASSVAGSVETEALNAIRGDYGNGLVRKEKLGSSYTEVQSRVNQLKRAGKF